MEGVFERSKSRNEKRLKNVLLKVRFDENELPLVVLLKSGQEKTENLFLKRLDKTLQLFSRRFGLVLDAEGETLLIDSESFVFFVICFQDSGQAV